MSETEVKVRTHVHKLKCMNCSLHFTVYSDNEDWKPAHCPECGVSRGFMHWQDTSQLFIFEHVPGTTALKMLG